MVFYGGKELAASFRTVRGNTITIAEEIPEEQYNFRPAPEVRSVQQLLAHIALVPSLQFETQSNRVTDLKTVNFVEFLQKMAAEENKPRTKAETIALLQSEGEKFATFLEGLEPGFLAETVIMPPGGQQETKTRFEMLLSPKEHEMHHRGQLMTVQRIIGIVPHLTRQFQERMAAHMNAPAPAAAAN